MEPWQIFQCPQNCAFIFHYFSCTEELLRLRTGLALAFWGP